MAVKSQPFHLDWPNTPADSPEELNQQLADFFIAIDDLFDILFHATAAAAPITQAQVAARVSLRL